MQILCCRTHLSTASVDFRAEVQARGWFSSLHGLHIHSHLSPGAVPQQPGCYGLSLSGLFWALLQASASAQEPLQGRRFLEV